MLGKPKLQQLIGSKPSSQRYKIGEFTNSYHVESSNNICIECDRRNEAITSVIKIHTIVMEVLAYACKA